MILDINFTIELGRYIMKTNYVIIGNGIAGLSAAKEIRNRDKDGSITLVSSEEYLTYYRVKLSHYISKDFEDKELYINKADWYEKMNIEVLLGKIVEKIDVDSRSIKLDDGKIINYDKLLIANGSRPFIPPIAGKFKAGVFALRTLKDLRHIKKYFSLCEDITVVGGGLLGLEAAWAIKELGKKVNIVEFAPYLLPRQLDKELAEEVSEKLRKHGLNLYFDAAAEEILGETRVDGLKFKDGRTIKSDAVLISAGVRPNLDLVIDSDIKYDKGIKVDKHMRTNIEDIYAAGDVAEVDGNVIGLWGIANDQGKTAGENMTEGNKEYKLPEPFTTLSIGDISLFSVGNVKDFSNTIEYKENNVHHKLFITEGKLTGAVLLGDTSPMIKVKKAVNNNLDISEHINNGLGFKEIIEKL